MRYAAAVWGVLVLTTGLTMAQAAEPKTLDRMEVGPVDATAAWVAADAGWPTGEVSFAADGVDGPIKLRGWVAGSDAGLRVWVEVSDPQHLNQRSGGEIWDGDFLRVAIDGWGDGTGVSPADTSGLFGDDDSSIGFALTPNGPVGWTYATKVPATEGVFPAHLVSIVRDEPNQLTRYDLTIPWDRVGIRPGALPVIGMTVQVRDAGDPAKGPVAHARWGDGANEPKPGLFKRIHILWPDDVGDVLTVTRTTIWAPEDFVEVIAGLRAHGGQIQVDIGDRPGLPHNINGQANDTTGRWYAIRWRPEPGGPDSIRVSIKGDGDSVDVRPVVAATLVTDINARLEDLIRTSPHPLFTRHLRSLRAIVREEYARAGLYEMTNRATADESLRHLAAIRDGLQTDAATWEPYAKGLRPLQLAYLSRRDGTLQWYELNLPQGWDAAKHRDEQPAFPMFLELHGSGNPHFLNHAAGRLSAKPNEGNRWVGYHVYPFGRGNSGYRDIGETDVWEAYEDAQTTFKIDEDRRYLFGFSMGGSGTWALGSRTPDRWAAIAILGMGANARPELGLGRNMTNTPVYIWGGEDDRIAFRGTGTPKEQIEAFAAELTKRGATVVAGSTPGVGHNYLQEKQDESYSFLRQHVRRRPDRFEFVADSPRQTGIWGVRMGYDPSVSGSPSFVCTIDGKTVTITSTGTKSLTLDLADKGLKLSGDVKVIWNGKEVFAGAAKDGVEVKAE